MTIRISNLRVEDSDELEELETVLPYEEYSEATAAIKEFKVVHRSYLLMVLANSEDDLMPTSLEDVP